MVHHPGLTVAIPTMRRWTGFLEKQLPVFLEHPRVECVVVCDETGEDVQAICEAGLDVNPKLRLYVNESVLGVYGNKRKCMLMAPTEWVAILDSDNVFEASYIDNFWASVKKDGEESRKTVYCAGKNIRLFLETGAVEDRILHFSGMRIHRGNWNKVLGTIGWNYLLNDGNAVWPTDMAKVWPEMPESEIVGTDSLFAMRQAISAGYTLYVDPTLKYIHTVHSGSHWLQNERVSTQLMGKRDWRL